MSKISRRHFVATGTVAGLSGSLLTRFAQAQQPLYVRYNVASPQGQANLAKYSQAVQIMMNRAPFNWGPLSWVYEWYTHWVRGDSTKEAQLAAIYGSGSSPAKTLATQVWDTCQAHANPGGPDEWFFLPWHRMYVYYLERICRKVLEDNTFALPYWNYSSPNAHALPAAFRVPGTPLYRVNRNPGVNAGNPIGSANALSPNPSLSRPSYAGASGFNQTLDFGLHGNVHSLVGNQQGMGSVPWAANDPIFWMHHCNIDRLWASWNKAGRKNPAGAAGAPWLNKTFVFADENGMAVTAKVGDFDTTTQRGYTYDHFEPVPPVAAAGLVAALAEPTPVTLLTSAAAGGLAASSGIPLAETGTRVTLTPLAGAQAAAGETALTARVDALPIEKQLYLTIRNYRADQQPGVIYDIYLDLPPAGAPNGGEGHYVGSLNFFGVVPHDGHESHTASAAVMTFDITDLSKRLKSEGQLTNTPTVTIVPAGTPAEDSKPVIGEITIVEQ
jgi:tyrosinase